jgi:hypothetical protein
MFTETRGPTGAARQSLTGLFSRSAKLITYNPLILYLLLLSACITVVEQIAPLKMKIGKWHPKET